MINGLNFGVFEGSRVLHRDFDAYEAYVRAYASWPYQIVFGHLIKPQKMIIF